MKFETKKKIADEFLTHKINWSGRLNEAVFLSRLFDIKNMRSTDERYESAYHDILQHRLSFLDWENNWVFTDNRFDLLHASDDIFLKFLCEVLHPAVRPNSNDSSEFGEETEKILKIFNHHLLEDNLKLVPKRQPLGKPLFEVTTIDSLSENLVQKQVEIIDYLSSEYVKQQISIMEKGIELSPYDAIGKSKELVETICKSILEAKGSIPDPNWTLMKLVKETNKVLELIPKTIPNYKQAESALTMVLNGISAAIHGLAELRNHFGSGHGHKADFQGLEKQHAKLCVGFVIEFARFYLDILKNAKDK